MSSGHRVLVVGAGGLGSPVLRLLAQSAVEHVTLVDDDVVEESNLHRQTLFTEKDLGRPKTECAMERLLEASPKLSVSVVDGRFVPSTAMKLLAGHTLVVEGADNLATKFLVADAAHLAEIPAVQAGAVPGMGGPGAPSPTPPAFGVSSRTSRGIGSRRAPRRASSARW